MGNLLPTYQLIADILSFKSNDAVLESKLKNGIIDWVSLVKVGSSHLVLPTIYCRLKSRNLLGCIPKDLDSYLKEITELNRERNIAIKDQAKVLAQLFKDHNIEYVFLKGVALLMGNYYNDEAERMIGDIDILIAKPDLDKAFKLLENKSYKPIQQTLGSRFFEHKHLPRLTTSQYICAVELHRKLFITYEHEGLTNSNILENKVKYNEFYLPCLHDLLAHNILNYQINDKGKLYRGLNFRASFDTLVINKNYQADLTSNTFKNKLVKHYYYRLNNFYQDFNSITPKKSGWFLNFKLKNRRLLSAWNKLITAYSYFGDLLKRLLLFVINSSYRNAIWNDRIRIIKLLKIKIFSKSF